MNSVENGKECEAVLAATNPLLGRGVFVFLKLPESWKLLKTSMSPECNALGREIVGDGFRWITSGFIHAILVDEQKNQAYPLFLDVKEIFDNEKALEIIRRRFDKLASEGERIEMEKIHINGHEAHCVTWISQKKMFLKRKKVILANLEYATYCDATKRLILFRISSSHIENFMEDKEKMLSILSSLTCHF
ncbi:MAG: hypothetical protein QMD13_06555 [Candidatus Bathyarchaeia archaeon]|nr:hypothetical protein [Candidatus Bathyarchaeota archaeon]MDI6905129.1 hypothetical protein [Candidatus Bathyarchaeia archaeon]